MTNPNAQEQGYPIGSEKPRTFDIQRRRAAHLLRRTVNKALRLLPQSFKKVTFYGKRRYCPVCESHIRRFWSAGLVPRRNAWCPVCGSGERHRLAWLFFSEATNLLDTSSKAMLHVAPEPALETKFRQVDNLHYLTADLHSPGAMVKMDITDIQYPEDSFDVIYCSHVLEHIPDDRRALRELNRVLKPDGFAVIVVPINALKTFEDPSVTNPAERERLFGQHDHVRRYGPDFEERLREAAFEVQVFRERDVVQEKDLERLGVLNEYDPFGELIFLCKQAKV